MRAKRIYSKVPAAEQIENIMKEFDFQKVEKAMRALNWSWGNPGEIPTVERLQEVALHHLHEVAQKDYVSVRSGGFVAKKDRFGQLGLIFYVDYKDFDDPLVEMQQKPSQSK